jgi:Core-2/I-Branching enzyme
MDKVAFLLLTANGFTKPNLWKRFFDESDERWNLYVHQKEKSSIPWIDNRVIKKHFETDWGELSLVKATNALLEEAFKDKDNKIFVLLSESHCPLYNITKTIDILQSMKLPAFSIENARENLEFRWMRSHFKTVKGFGKANFALASQWWVMDRNTAGFFVSTAKDLEERCRLVFFSDEHYYISFLKEARLPYERKTTTHVTWTKTPEKYNRFISRPKPRTYFHIRNAYIRALRNHGYLFFRKVHERCEVDSDYILSFDCN